jgi:hypothetical protein
MAEAGLDEVAFGGDDEAAAFHADPAEVEIAVLVYAGAVLAADYALGADHGCVMDTEVEKIQVHGWVECGMRIADCGIFRSATWPALEPSQNARTMMIAKRISFI